MTEQELEDIEARANNPNPGAWGREAMSLDVPVLLAEVRRLRGLLKLARDEMIGEMWEGSWGETVALLNAEVGEP